MIEQQLKYTIYSTGVDILIYKMNTIEKLIRDVRVTSTSLRDESRKKKGFMRSIKNLLQLYQLALSNKQVSGCSLQLRW